MQQTSKFLAKLNGGKYKGGLGYAFPANAAKWVVPSWEEVQAFKAECGCNRWNGTDNVQIIAQEAGTLVTIPPGWVHWVYNLRPCMKVAWDPTDPTLLHKYVLAWRDVVCKHIGAAMPVDYAATLRALVVAVTNAVHVD